LAGSAALVRRVRDAEVARPRLELEDIEALYRRHRAAVYYRCLKLLCQDEEAALDAMHGTFTRAIRFSTSFRGDSEPLRWLFKIAFSVCMDHLRKERKIAHLVDVEALLEDAGAVVDRGELPFEKRLDEQRTVARLLPRFSPKVQEIVVLRFFDDMTVPEIAREVGASERTVARRLSEFMKRSRKLLEAES
jgi:RNA polymerase sigma-70 factor (ECF subfamily)